MNTIWWEKNDVVMIDQRKLPLVNENFICKNHIDMADAIKTMVIRGAPAIGIAAACGVALGIRYYNENKHGSLDDLFPEIIDILHNTRPTAVNLFWALSRMQKLYNSIKEKSSEEIFNIMQQESQKILEDDINTNKKIGHYGNTIVPENANILTHCNAGGLATGGYGTALGVIRAAHEANKNVHVFADETRPFLQGARLTMWELVEEKINATLITDNMAGYCMAKGMIDLVVVGADRITSNGDAANKIGTYSAAVLANRHNIPFYVAAPFSTIDFSLDSGNQITIEERDKDEVRKVHGTAIVPNSYPVFNPAFDVTPAELIKGIITEKGIIKPNDLLNYKND